MLRILWFLWNSLDLVDLVVFSGDAATDVAATITEYRAGWIWWPILYSRLVWTRSTSRVVAKPTLKAVLLSLHCCKGKIN